MLVLGSNSCIWLCSWEFRLKSFIQKCSSLRFLSLETDSETVEISLSIRLNTSRFFIVERVSNSTSRSISGLLPNSNSLRFSSFLIPTATCSNSLLQRISVSKVCSLEMFEKAWQDFPVETFTDPSDLADVVRYMLTLPPKIWLNDVRVEN